MSVFSKICFYGGGAWGQALSITLATLGHKSTILVSDKLREKEINNHTSKKFPNIKLDNLIDASMNKQEIIKISDLIFITTESKRVLEAIYNISLISKGKINVVITSKGFATNKGKTFSEIVENEFPNILLSILTGPTFADEIANKKPATAVVANKDINLSLIHI